MLRLAVTTRAETFERMADPLADRDIDVVHVQAKERTLSLTGDPDLPDVDVGFVYPSRLMEGGVVDTLLDVPWVNDREAILTSRNKAGVLAALSQAGIPVPETTLVSNPVDESELVDAVGQLTEPGGLGADTPVVVKPNSTTRGTGIAKATDLDSLLGTVDYLNLVHDYRATGDRAYLLQEYLPDARDYRAMVVDGEFVGAVERRLPENAVAEGRWKHNVHRGAEAVGVDLPDEHRRLAERAAEVLDIPYLGVDLLETEERLVVNETNARPTIDAATKYEPGFYDKLAAMVRRRTGE
ncbi:ribosomal protein S6--L-glutamate ligase [Halogranum gelatinilyticum]|uniref:Ribosomal protein S6--L-glutamate ligase n=1 Tax=Halogranum gelatinilyticum TaxID=660521 RepID=A0A1G9PT44_9EURY|nr:RimK family alpha-L-glutamate ligase [Halogranum gelatinilyticum]SDM01972.1 ribosomal protein S6--L-glutamate ligase [Halogranum gelatinilyticum]